jgi:hypothetical protein
MSALHPRVLNVIRPAALLLALGACGAEERTQRRAELQGASQCKEDLTRRVATLEAEGASDRRLLLDYRKKAEEADALKARVDELTKEAEKKKEELERVEGHRDELKEWVETELLPIAEEKDPRLVNLRDTAKEMAAEVEKIRGLAWKHPFMRRLLSRSQMATWMQRDAAKQLPPEKAKKDVAVGVTFGLVKPGTDLIALFAQFADAGVAAFYKPETRTFYHIEGNDGRGARPVVFHELVHALEDQYFDLDALDKSAEGDSDREIAIKGLVEGSAAYHQGLYEAQHPNDLKAMVASEATPEMIEKQRKMAGDVPPGLIAVMALYPYNNGKAWVASMHPDAAAMERLFRDPPVSSEQVLHPAKFPLDGPRDYPHKVGKADIGPVLGDGWESIGDDDMGELMTGVLLSQLQWRDYLPSLASMIDLKTQGLGFKGNAKKGSEGWDGDHYVAFQDKATGAVTIVWVSVWDTEQDAQEFADIYADGLSKRMFGKALSPRPSPLRFTDAKTGRVTGIDVAGTRVVAVLEAPPAKAAALFAAGAASKIEADPRDANDTKAPAK